MLKSSTPGHNGSKTAFSTLLIVALLIPLTAAAQFTDLKPDNQNFNAINYLEQNNVIKGYKDGTFKPDQTITRAELIKFALTHVGYKPAEKIYETKFKDVPADSWFAPYVKKCLELQAIQINPDLPLFYPSAPISKIEALKIIMPIEGIPAPYIQDPTPIIFSDVNEKSSFAYLVIAAEKAGLYTKMDGTLLKPFKNLTRGEAAELLYRSQAYRDSQGTSDSTGLDLNQSDYYSSSDYALISNPKFPIFLDIWSKINDQFINKETINQDDLVYGAISGMVQSLDDKYSVFEKPENAKDIQDSLEGSFDGIGIVLDTVEENVVITGVLKDSPAQKAGLKAGDFIQKVNGESVTGKKINDVVTIIKGPAGTDVTLSILRDGGTTDFTIKREQLKLDSVLIESTSPTKIPDDIGYISIYQFTSDTGTEFADILKKELDKKPVGMILDLRDNPGGYLDAAYLVLNHFVPKNKPLANMKIESRIIPQLSDGPGEFTNAHIPLIVLVNDNTASAAEVVAGALQDYGIGKLLGITTYGKGTVQEVTDYTDNSFFKLSIAHWLTAKEHDINKVGLTPDIKVETTADDALNKTDSQLEKAIAELQQ